MFLSAHQIRQEIESGRIVINPFTPGLLKPASYVLRLGDRTCQWTRREEAINVWSPCAGEKHLGSVIRADDFILPSGGFALASTLERVSVPNDLVGIISTLSHLARFGLSVHANSFWVNPGFGMHTQTFLTLELASVNPSAIHLKSGIPVCHLSFARTSSKPTVENPLTRSVYEGRDPLAIPMLFEEYSFLNNQ